MTESLTTQEAWDWVHKNETHPPSLNSRKPLSSSVKFNDNSEQINMLARRVVCVLVCVCVGVCVLVCGCVCLCVSLCVSVCVSVLVCVVCGLVWCGVVWCGVVWCLVWCAFNTSPCVRSKRSRVYRQHAHMLKTCGHVAGTHRDILNAHTGTC